MSFGFPPTLLALLIATAGTLVERSVRAQDTSPAEPANMLGNFFKLGLPDSRGAKWVRLQLSDEDPRMDMFLRSDSRKLSGNAWLVREESGVIELVFDHLNVRAQRVEREDEETRGKLPRAKITDADLDADVKLLLASLKPGRKGTPGQAIRVAGYSFDSEQAPPVVAANALLFAAHLQRQALTDEAQEIVRAALAFAPGPASFDLAIAQIAEARLHQLSGEFFEQHDHAAYARAIEKLAAEFPRRWRQRDAALLLAKRARTQKPGAFAGDPNAKKAADFLLGLKKNQAAGLPLRSNWLLPGESESWARYARYLANRGMPMEESAARPDSFKQPRAVFAGLARLLDDHRLLAFRRDDVWSWGRSVGFYSGGERSRAQRIENEYSTLERPMEVGELAWALIESVLPRKLRSEIERIETGRIKRVLTWFGAIAPLSDEELARITLRNCEGNDDAGFQPALKLLVQKGNAESQKLLAKVFLNPAVWSNYRGQDEMMAQLEAHVARLGADGPAFGEKLRPVVAAALKAQSTTRVPPQRSERYVNAGLKKFDQIFKPQGFAELLDELVSEDGETWWVIWQILTKQLQKMSWAEAEPQLFQTAAKAKNLAVRSGILWQIRQRQWIEFGPNEPPPRVPDAATRAAVGALFADETPLPQGSNSWSAPMTFSDLTALAFTIPRLPRDDYSRWYEELRRIPEFAFGWLKEQTRALLADKPPLPMPSAARVPAGRLAEILKEFAALPPERIFEALLAKTADEQAAIANTKPTEWPPAVTSASLIVASVEIGNEVDAKWIDFARWKGRPFDEGVYEEIRDAVQKAALDGHACTLSLTPIGLLGGVNLKIQGPDTVLRRMNKEQLANSKIPLLKDEPLPDAVMSLAVISEWSNHTKRITFSYAIWNNPDLTRAWQERFARPADRATKPGSDENDGLQFEAGFFGNNDPEPLENALRDVWAGKFSEKREFQIRWTGQPIGEASNTDRDN